MYAVSNRSTKALMINAVIAKPVAEVPERNSFQSVMPKERLISFTINWLVVPVAIGLNT